jgi:hypothetical protein
MRWRWIVLGLFACGVIGAAFGPPPRATIPTSDGTKPSATPLKNVSYVPAVVEAEVRARLRDPASAVFGDMYAVGDRKIAGQYSGAVCGDVNSRNGFGGYAGKSNFIYLMALKTVEVDPRTNNAEFVKLYNRICAGPHG